jgi:hypothetical protein
MSTQLPERIPYTTISGPAYVFFNKDYHLTQFLGALAVHTTNGLRPFVPLIVDLVLCRAVDNYQAYINDLLTLIYTTTPGGRKPKKLSHMGVLEQNLYVKGQLTFSLFQNSAELEQVGRIIEIRNLFTHDRGIISPRFLERVPGFKGMVGEPIRLPLDDVGDDLTFLQGSVRNIDFRAGRTFKIPRTLPLFGTTPPKPAQ